MRKPILVTGAHRTGTTWVGEMLGRAPRMYYVHEPFSPNRGEGDGKKIFDRWYSYVDERNEKDYFARISDEIFEGPEAREARGEEEGRNKGDTGALKSAKNALRPLRRTLDPILPVVKDPIALLSAPWLARQFDMNVVVMIRHPAGFAASLRRQDWAFPFGDPAAQSSLMEGPLKEFAEEIRDFAENERDILEQAGLLWKIFYSVIARYRRENVGWHYVVYEELVRDSKAGFRELYKNLGLRGADEILNKNIDDRDPEAWRSELSASELAQLREATEPAWREFYSEKDWG